MDNKGLNFCVHSIFNKNFHSQQKNVQHSSNPQTLHLQSVISESEGIKGKRDKSWKHNENNVETNAQRLTRL
jgi:hypothetical protein